MSEEPDDPTLILAQEVLDAVRVVAQRHQLNPLKKPDCIVLAIAFSEVLMALVKHADPAVDGIVISSNEDDGLGVVMTVHTAKGYFEVNMPKETMS